jgi:hypothetical protein
MVNASSTAQVSSWHELGKGMIRDRPASLIFELHDPSSMRGRGDDAFG